MILRGPTITLRYPESTDAARIFQMASDPDVGGWFSWGPYEEIGQAEAWLARYPDERIVDMRFDAVLVAPGRIPRHIAAAFEVI